MSKLKGTTNILITLNVIFWMSIGFYHFNIDWFSFGPDTHYQDSYGTLVREELKFNGTERTYISDISPREFSEMLDTDEFLISWDSQKGKPPFIYVILCNNEVE